MILTMLTTCMFLAAYGQSEGTRIARQQTNGEFADFIKNMPDARILNSGSKIIVEYEGDWPEDMKGAFEYAAKIWEENIPMCVPLHIKARVSDDDTMTGYLSSVYMFTASSPYVSGTHGDYLNFPSSLVKSQMLTEYNRMGGCSLFNHPSIDRGYMLTCDDMEITYNSGMADEFSFNLDAEVDADKYDFVTLAMRDIAFGLGMANGLLADSVNGRMLFSDDGHTPFEELILDSIGWDDGADTYSNATAGTVAPGFGLSLYAPNPFVNGKSLRFTVAEDGNPLNYLLSHDFGKGFVMRDIANYDWTAFFGSALGWDPGIVVGSDTGSLEEMLVSEQTLPFKGSFSFENAMQDSGIKSRMGEHEVFASDNAAAILSESGFSTTDFLRKHSLMADSEKDSSLPRDILSIQLKDGSWDVVKSQSVMQGPLVVNLDDALPRPEEEYARSTTGKLKYRIVRKKMKSSSMFGEYTKPENLEVRYFTREFTPQTPVISYTGKIMEPETVAFSEQDYYDFVDVKVEISNVEGALQMAVEQMDEGEIVPFTYEIEDFRKGYFVANLDPECSTTLTLISANKNGLRRSNTICIPALVNHDRDIAFRVGREAVEISGLGEAETQRGKISYTLTSPLSSVIISEGTVGTACNVDVSALPSGFYILTVNKNGRIIGSTKFAR